MASETVSPASCMDTSTSSSSQPVQDLRESESDTESEATVSLLDRLKCPSRSVLSRARKVHCNPPPRGRKRSTGERKASNPDVPPSKRVSEYPGELLTVSAGILFCKACREVLSVKRSTVDSHVKCAKHVESKKKVQQSESRERDIAEALQRHNEATYRKSETLPQDQRIYRVKVVQTFLRAGVPLSKLAIFRPLLEEKALRLCDTRHMLDLVPFILDEERARIKKEIEGKFVSVIFDGTSRLGEVLAVVLRFFAAAPTIQQCLVRLEFLTKSMSGEEVARELIHVLSTVLGIRFHLVLAVMRDRASVNNVAIQIMKVVCPKLIDVGCFSHTLDHVSEKFNTPTLNTFSTLWISLFSRSQKAKAQWREQTGQSMATFSKTRWWSWWEVLHQLLQQFGDVQPFLERNIDIGAATRPKLLEILTDQRKYNLLRIELAVTIDLGEHFVKLTYRLEGNGPLVLECYEVITTLKAVIRTVHYPNVRAISRLIAPSTPVLQQNWFTYAMNCVQSGIDYFQKKFGDETQCPLAAFKAARLFSPPRVHEVQPVAADVDLLSVFLFINVASVEGLKAELPIYLVRAAHMNPQNFDAVEWWKQNEDQLPQWSLAAKMVFLVQPSSAASERVFSILNNSFGDRQQNSLEDYVESSIMLQYNNR